MLCLLARVSDGWSSEVEPVAERYISMALQGNLRPAESLFAAMDPEQGSMEDFELAERFQARFTNQSERLASDSGDTQVDALVAAYRTYWAQVLMGELSPEQGRQLVEETLAGLLGGSEAALTAPQKDIFQRTGRFLDERGLHHLETPAPPLLDLFVWKKEYSRYYTVKLTDLTREVRVAFMSDMVSKGWKDFASLGLASTTGWVDQGRLYCVEWAYDRTSEQFTISFLKHESRHLADLERYPGMSSTELEYRAKLTELAFASSSLRSLLDDFTSKSADNPDSPHAHANFRVTRDLYRELSGKSFPKTEYPWKELDIQSVNAAARELLERNTGTIGVGGI